MLCHRYDVLSACLAEKLSPLLRVELLRLEHGDKVFVTEILMIAICLNMVIKLIRALNVHIP